MPFYNACCQDSQLTRGALTWHPCRRNAAATASTSCHIVSGPAALATCFPCFVSIRCVSADNTLPAEVIWDRRFCPSAALFLVVARTRLRVLTSCKQKHAREAKPLPPRAPTEARLVLISQIRGHRSTSPALARPAPSTGTGCAVQGSRPHFNLFLFSLRRRDPSLLLVGLGRRQGESRNRGPSE